MDCVLNDADAIYCSSELTSGKRLYDELRKHGLKGSSELKKKFGEAWFEKNIFDVNTRFANEFAASVRAKQTDGTPVITPAPFSVKDWGQPEYLAFWEELIHTRIKAVCFNKKWEFSNGCTFEFAVAQQACIPTFDYAGNPLGLEIAIASVGEAIEQLEKDGFDIAKLQENFQLLQSLDRSQEVIRQSIPLTRATEKIRKDEKV